MCIYNFSALGKCQSRSAKCCCWWRKHKTIRQFQSPGLWLLWSWSAGHMGVYRPAVLDVSTSPRTGSNHTFNSKHLLPYKHVFSRDNVQRNIRTSSQTMTGQGGLNLRWHLTKFRERSRQDRRDNLFVCLTSQIDSWYSSALWGRYIPIYSTVGKYNNIRAKTLMLRRKRV